MRNVVRIVGGSLLAVVALSYLTNHDYLWGGIRETWLRGWENAQIDDLQFREHVRTIPASSNPQPWPEGPLWGKAVLSEEPRHGMRKTSLRASWSSNTTVWCTNPISADTTPRP